MKSADISIMYHLVGEQPLPVFLAAKQFTGCKHVLWHTERSAKTCNDLYEVMAEQQLHVEKRLIGSENVAYDILQLRDIFGRAFRDDVERNECIGLNATGGTKPMSLVGLTTLQATAQRDRFMACYVDSVNQRLLSLAGDWASEDFRTSMTIGEFLGIAGAKILGKNLDAGYEIMATRRDIVMTLWKSRECLQRYQGELSKFTDKRLANLCTPPAEYLDFMAQASKKHPVFATIHGHESFKSDWRAEARFLTGGWFEEYCFWKISSAPGSERIKEIRLGLKTAWRSGQLAVQEFDVCYTDGLRLFILECKAGAPIQDYVQKLENICAHFSGSLGRAALVSVNDVGLYKEVADRFRNSNNLACFSGKDGVDSLCKDIWHIAPGELNRKKAGVDGQ